MPATSNESLFMAGTVADAVAALAERGPAGVPLAGGTWIMRAPIRREARASFHVGIGHIPELTGVDIGRDQIRVGACVTHSQMTAQLAGTTPCSGLVTAAGSAANPAIRRMATVGGNLSTWDFPAADLPPALLCLDADVELRTGTDAVQRLRIEDYLAARQTLEPGTLLTGIVIARREVLTGHARLPLRKAGDYPVSIVSLAVALGGNGRIEDVKLAVGSVEATARRWRQLEQRLIGLALDPAQAAALAETELGSFQGRDGIEAPGWYRVQVLPALVRRAAEAALASRS